LEELPQLQPWLTWTELTGEPRDMPGKRQALTALILKYPRENILRACATISALFSFGPEGNTTADEALTEVWIPRLFQPDLVEKVKAYAAGQEGHLFSGSTSLSRQRSHQDPARSCAAGRARCPQRGLGRTSAEIRRIALPPLRQAA
jgi:hypothetical protein